MSEVRVTNTAPNLRTNHSMTSVLNFYEVCPIEGLEETRPATAGFKLRIRLEEWRTTADAAKNSHALFIEMFAGPWWFRAALPGHMEAFWTQQLSPFAL